MANAIENLKAKIGVDVFERLEKEASIELGLALKMPLLDKWRKEDFYQPRFLLNQLLPEMKKFEEVGLKVSPLEVVTLLFRCKLLFKVANQDEYYQRCGGGGRWRESPMVLAWEERSSDVLSVTKRHLELLEASVRTRTLIAEITQFTHTQIDSTEKTPREFLMELFNKLEMPFCCFFDDEPSLELLKSMHPQFEGRELNSAKSYFNSPSIGFTATGSDIYVHFYATTWLRTFLSMLRIAHFFYPNQMDFGQDVKFMAPTGSTFLDTPSSGCYSWDEDSKKPWEKIADGNLFLSFGYRGLAKMYFDRRYYGSVEKFFVENKIILDHLQNPWSDKNIRDIAPTIDLLNTVTQMPDLGAKILLIYTCLEHLFVPPQVTSGNTKYIIGAINALNPDLLPWFERLYKARNSYAHKGFIQSREASRGLVFESVRNTVTLLTSKLRQGIK